MRMIPREPHLCQLGQTSPSTPAALSSVQREVRERIVHFPIHATHYRPAVINPAGQVWERSECKNKGVLSTNSLLRHCCCERGVSISWLSWIGAPQSEPISAAAAHFGLTPWLWPPSLHHLQNWSHPLTTPQGFTWPMDPFSAPHVTH